MKFQGVNIFGYIDFKKYLEDYYQQRKRVDPGFKHDYICSRLGQANARSYFNNVIKGRTNVTPTFIDRFILLLELSQNEANYFRALVNYNQAFSPQEKEFFFNQIVQLNSTPHRVLDTNTYAYYKEWYHSALRALLDIVDFKDNYRELCARLFPPITLKQARHSIALLKNLGLIAPDKQGFWKPTDKVVSTGEFINDALIQQFQMKCLEHARNVIAHGVDQAHRNITLTISLSDEAYQRVSGRVQQFKSEIRSIVQKDNKKANRVYHINLNVFPMSS
jgi:uncharacterized protein (TIGR02147 family)